MSIKETSLTDFWFMNQNPSQEVAGMLIVLPHLMTWLDFSSIFFAATRVKLKTQKKSLVHLYIFVLSRNGIFLSFPVGLNPNFFSNLNLNCSNVLHRSDWNLW